MTNDNKNTNNNIINSQSIVDNFLIQNTKSLQSVSYNIIQSLFEMFFKEAKQNKQILDATAFFLSTANLKGEPDGRIVLLKHFDERGFTFFTNKNSKKGVDISQNPKASMCFYWDEMGIQIRIKGTCEYVSNNESDEYFNSRSLYSKIGAVASMQSQILKDREAFANQYKNILDKTNFKEFELKRPEHWGGIRVVPSYIEFWHDRPYRLHDRTTFTKQQDGSWLCGKIYP